jgi:hypothetical protein
MNFADVWSELGFGYFATILIEAPILAIGLSVRHTPAIRWFAGAWLTACTYLIVNVVIPFALNSPDGRVAGLVIGEIFAPAAECGLFWAAFGPDGAIPRAPIRRDLSSIVLANLVSFGLGEALKAAGYL